MNRIKEKLKVWCPSIIYRFLRRIIEENNEIRFEETYLTWQDANAQCSGYSSKEILDKIFVATLKVKKGEAVYERDSMIFDQIEYSWPVLFGLMWAAAQNSGYLKVLDFGGSLGSRYFENLVFLNTLPQISWNVIEQANFVEAGQKHFQNKQLKFFKTIEDSLADNTPNVILLSSVLQYLPDPGETIDSLKGINCEVIIIDRTIVNSSNINRAYIQHVPASIYNASYPCYSLSEPWLINKIGNNYEMQIEFPSIDFPVLHHIDSEFKGYIFKKRF